MNRLKIGVLGVGNMGRNHVRILSEEKAYFDLVGIYDADESRASYIAQQFDTMAFADMDTLLEQLEAVVIAVPSSLHTEVALRAAAHGLHALVEKPLALNSGDARMLTEAFARKNRLLMVGHVERFNPVVTELTKLLKHERILSVEARRYSPYSSRITDANVVEDLMIHDVDLVCGLFLPGNPLAVDSCGVIHHSGLPDLVHSILRFECGAVANISASRVTESKIRRIDVHTERSYIVADLLARSLQVIQNTNLVVDEGKDTAYRQDSVTRQIFVPTVEPLRLELLSFHRCITQGEQPEANGAAAVCAIEICERIIDQIKARLENHAR